jgi:hypothetical protein
MLGNAMNAQVLQRILECVMGLPTADDRVKVVASDLNILLHNFVSG